MSAIPYLLLSKPTRLYQKQCSHCSLKYFGKHTGENIEQYKGSGTYWRRHLKKHKAKSIHVWNSDWYTDKSIEADAYEFCAKNNIVESKEWANIIVENGIDGGDTSKSPNWIKAQKSGLLSHKGESNGMFGLRGEANPNFGKKRPGTGRSGINNVIPQGSKRSAEVKKKISETVKKTTSDPEWRALHSKKAKQRCTQEWRDRVAENNKRQICCVSCGKQMGISSLGRHRSGKRCIPTTCLPRRKDPAH